MIGGGASPVPGEVSLAHNGILFLEDLPATRRGLREVLLEPMAKGQVTISRASGDVAFPSRFMLIAAMNPCPCGFHGDSKRQCRCTPHQIRQYRGRLSGPLMDRIDIQVELPAIDCAERTGMPKGESSATIRERVINAKAIQQRRFQGHRRMTCNADLNGQDVQRYCSLDSDAGDILRNARNESNTSVRDHHQTLRVARTIADLAGSSSIRTCDLAEAVRYRCLDPSLID